MGRPAQDRGRQRPGSRPALTFRDLAGRLDAVAGSYSLHGRAAGAHDAGDAAVVLEGDFFNADFHSGLSIHATDAVEQHDGCTEIELPAAVTVSILLEGRIAASIGGRALEHSADRGASGRIWSLTEPARLVRQIRRGERVRKINITMTPAWFAAFLDSDAKSGTAQHPALPAHLQVHAWRPSDASLRYAEEILTASDARGLLNRLETEMRAFGILRDAFASLAGAAQPDSASGMTTRDAARARAVRDHVDAHLTETLTLEAIAAATGMSVSTMQRVFKTAYGLTVTDHLRFQRLDLARKALTLDGLSIQRAAHLAGYSSPANFATAFKRRFGFPPSLCQD